MRLQSTPLHISRHARALGDGLGLLPCIILFVVLGGALGCRDPEQGPEPTVTHDLLAELADGELISEIRGLDFGTTQSRPFLHRGFSRDHFERRLQRPYVWGVGEGSEISLPMLRRRDAELVLELRPLQVQDAPPQNVEVSFNGSPLGRIELGPHLGSYRVTVPASTQVLGNNSLSFRYAWNRRPSQVGGAATDHRQLAVAFFSLRWSRPSPAVAAKPQIDIAAGRVFLPQGIRLDLYLALEGSSSLTAEQWSFRGDSSRLRLSLQEEGQNEAQTVADLDAPPPDGTLALPGEGRRLVRLSLESLSREGIPQALDPDLGIVWQRPQLENTVEVPSAGGPAAGDPAAGGPAAGGPAADGPPADGPPADSDSVAATPAAAQTPTANPTPHLILYMIDTLRADHLGAYGYGRTTSPHFDALASQSLLFEQAIAQSSWTRSSVASLFTGLWPLAHGTNLRDHVLPEDAVVLAELLRQRGYRTAAFLANPNVSELFGFAQGFDHVRDYGAEDVDAVVINEHVAAWLDDQQPETPLFLYIHTIDPHSPYDPPSPYRERFAPLVAADVAWTPNRLPRSVRRRRSAASAEQMAEMVGLYDAEIAYADAALGELRQMLEGRQLFDNSLLVVVSDHGEEFLEHGYLEHGKNLFVESLHIPLLIKPAGRPGVDFQPRRIGDPVQHIDLLPTLGRQLGLPPDSAWQGRDLSSLWQSTGQLKKTPIFSYLHLDGAPRIGLRRGDWKVIQRLQADQLVEPHLYHLPSDPGEQKDLATSRPIRLGYLSRLLRQRLSSPEGRLEAGSVEIDERLRLRLEALGYLQ